MMALFSIASNNHLREAEATIAAALTVTAEFLEFHYQKGIGYININRWYDAKSELETVFEIDPNYKDVQDKLKEVYAKIEQLTPPPSSTSQAISDLPTSVPIATTLAPAVTLQSDIDWKAYIFAGQEFLVIFDETHNKFDDSKYTGDWRTDPMGTLKGGEIYIVKFSLDTGWNVTGFNQDVMSVFTTAYPAAGASPLENRISLWGAIFTFDDKGQVFFRDYGLVGHLKRR